MHTRMDERMAGLMDGHSAMTIARWPSASGAKKKTNAPAKSRSACTVCAGLHRPKFFIKVKFSVCPRNKVPHATS